MTDMFKRKFDGPLQQPGVRQPLKNPEQFKAKAAECAMLLFRAAEASITTTDELHVSIQINADYHERALRIADELVEMEPLRGIPWTLRAQALAGLGRPSEALASCERAVEIDPSDPAKWRLKSALLQVLGKAAEAEEAKKKAEELGT